MNKRIPRRILTVILSLAMLLTLMPAATLAADETGGTTTTSGIELSKTATLEDDGTYTINLEAYATGETTTTTTESSVPLDIVLVIDQSGSMAYNDSGNSTNTESDRRYYKLKTALNSFVSTIQQNAASTGADHRIAIAGYASNRNAGQSSVTGSAVTSGSSTSAWVNTGLYINGTMTPYGTSSSTSSSLTSTNYQNALVSANTDGSVTSSITTAISNMNFSGGTYTEYGLLMAQGVFKNNSATYTYTDENGDTQTGTRKRIVILFTDGETNSEIDDVLSASNTLKSTYNATVYCVGFGSSIDEDFLSYISSNYGSDTKYTESSGGSGGSPGSGGGPGGSTSGTYSGTSNNTTKYFMTATDSSELSNIFETISSDATSSSTTVTLDENSVMKDIMGDGFTLTSNSTVSIKTVAGTYNTETSKIDWGADTTNSASYSISGNTVSVTGFDYAGKYISSGHSGEKICVTITGVLPTTDVTTDEKVFTNSSASGIYADDKDETAVVYFPVPDTIITKKLYVLDYGKQVTLDGLDQSSVTGIADTYQAVDNVNGTDNALTVKDSCLTYGNATLDMDSKTLTYTPTTTNWNGYDSLYVFGQTSDETIKSYSANSNGNLWSKVSVIPASNVYYEDDFVTNESDGVVGIKYSGTWTTVSGDTSSASASQSSENILYGTDAAYADDTTYTDGSAHQLQSGATATFTFTGTGVDIYSSTDNDACIVYVYLYDAEDNLKQYVVANNYADDGKYYVVPTVTFEDLDYGTYTVKLRVVKSSTDSKAVNYYLDGIRVYNPLGTVTNNGSDAGDAYAAAGELNAEYKEIRTMLLDKNTTADFSGEDGALFIDEITDNTTGETTTNLTTYESVGPEHETYLKVGNGVAFTLSGFNAETDAVYVGIKLTGMSVETSTDSESEDSDTESGDSISGTVEVTDGSGKITLTITSTADQYYKITPDADGNVVIKNTSENGAVISLTKIRTTSAGTSSAVSVISDADTAEYALTTFSTLSLTSSSTEILTEDEAEDGNDDDAAVDTETEDDTTGDVVIETETPEQGSSSESSSQDIFSSIFNKIIGWFSGRR